MRSCKTSTGVTPSHSVALLWVIVSLFAISPAYASTAGVGGPFLFELTDDLEDEFENHFEDEIEDEIEDQIEELVENEIEDQVEDTIEDQVENEVELAIEESIQENVEDNLENQIEDHIASLVEEELEFQLDGLYEDERHALFTDTWLVMGDFESIMALEREGYILSNVETLDGLGYVLGTITAPQTHKPGELGIASIEVLNSPLVSVDLNERYLPQTTSGQKRGGQTTISPISNTQTRIGIIDSRVANQHPAFEGASISQASFVPDDLVESEAHGTAIASILVGEADHFTGLVPHANLMIGSVFGHEGDGKIFATTAAIVRALDWLTRENVKVVNMSLAGPDNFILRRAIEAACNNGVTIVASVGNGGPTSSPRFPAAYDCTIGVTAVDATNKVYHRAGRGDHVDFASYGVNVSHAIEDGGFSIDSGTSYAATVVSAILASDVDPLQDHTFSKNQLMLRARDLGKPGHDDIYGFGLLAPAHLTAQVTPVR